MKTLACADFGADCKFVAKGNTNEEVMNKMMEHVGKSHPDKMEEVKGMPKSDIEMMIKEE
ncbi:MAG: DUF1059 domain-containing protein [Candidatus Buchananbacteria bacterium]